MGEYGFLTQLSCIFITLFWFVPICNNHHHHIHRALSIRHPLISEYSIHHSQPHSCSEAALSLVTCLEEMDCVKKDGRSMSDCLKDNLEMDIDCKAQKEAYFMCKHAQLNMRTRIRGVRTY